MRILLLFPWLFTGALATHFIGADKMEELVSFTYSFSPSHSGENWVVLNGQIRNNGPNTLYFISESCNDMNDYLLMDSSEVSYLVKNKIKTGGAYSFTAVLKKKRAIGIESQINLKFIESFKDNTTKTTILKGKLIQNN